METDLRGIGECYLMSSYESNKGDPRWTTEQIVEFISLNPVTNLTLNHKELGGKTDDIEKIFTKISNYNILVDLSLQCCSLGNTEIKAMMTLIKECYKITTISLYENNIGDEGAHEVAKFIKTNILLSYFDIGGNKLTDKGVNSISNSIVCSSAAATIEVVRFGNQGYADDGVLAVANLVDNCPKLFRLSFSCDTRATSFGAFTLLFHSLKRNVTLRHLTVHSTGDFPQQLVDDCFEKNTTLVECGSFASKQFEKYIILNSVCERLNASVAQRRSVPRQLETEEEIRRFLKESTEPWNSLKLVVLGNGEIGKTTLLGELKKAQREYLQKLKGLFKREKTTATRTIGVDRSSMQIGKGEVTIWDFGGQLEYTVTHHFFLSSEMVVYLVCFDLGAPLEKQLEQISYWLDFLNSSLPPSLASDSVPKWKVLVVGLRMDLCKIPPFNSSHILAWQNKWNNLPIHESLLCVSSKTSKGLSELFLAVEKVCESIFNCYTTSIPTSYKTLLHSIQARNEEDSITSLAQLQSDHSGVMSPEQFAIAMKYLHSIGHVVVLKGGLVCTSPGMIPKLAAKFISPVEAG